MNMKYRNIFLIILLGMELYRVLPCFPASCQSSNPATEPNNPQKTELDQTLDHMHNAVQTLTSLQADVDYLFIQDPELLEAKTFRKGALYYLKEDKKSFLRITFNTIQQDEEEPEVRPEHYLFDGVWLTKIDMSLETIDLYQKATADQPVGVFEFISHNFPMVGFTDPKQLEKDFIISLNTASSDPNEPRHLSLKVREDSVYKDDYKTIDVWVNRRNWLPDRLSAVSVQGDLYELKWHNLQINKKIPEDVFNIETPDHFHKNVHPLEK